MAIIKDKRGIAMESAIMFIVVIFSLCALISSIALLTRGQTKIEKNVATSQVALEQVGEDFLTSIIKGELNLFPTEYENYECTLGENGDRATLTVRLKNNTAVVLYVEAKLEGGKINVYSWNNTHETYEYGAPATDGEIVAH